MISLIVSGCEKGSIGLEEEKLEGKDFPCGKIINKSPVYYLNESNPNYSVNFWGGQAGSYGAFPEGLDINPSTGKIKINSSLTGLKYKVFFVKSGYTDTCFRFMTISGINYLDSIYVLESGNKFAYPVYNANPAAELPCEDDDGGECEFDDGNDDDNGNGTADEPPPGSEVELLGIEVNKDLGFFDLDQTVGNGTFGESPVSGTSVDFKMYYRLDDASAKALNDIDVRMYYFETLSEVPDSIYEQIAEKKDQLYRLMNTTWLPSSPLVDPWQKLDEIQKIAVRPPYIVIVGNFQ